MTLPNAANAERLGVVAETPSPQGQAEAMLRVVADRLTISLARCGRDLRYVTANRQYAERLGLLPEDVVGRRLPDVLGAAVFAAVEPSVAQALAGHAVEFDVELPFAAGGHRLMRCSYVPERDAAGDVTGFVIAATDVTARRRAERSLLDTDARFQAMADNIPQLAWMTRPDGWITWYNRRWFEYTGATLEAMQGWGWRAVHHPDHVDGVTERFRAALVVGEPWEDTFPLRGRDGAYRWFLSRARPIHGPDGAISAWFGTNTDITGQRETEASLARLNDELERRVAEAVAAREAAQARAAQAERLQTLGQLAGGIAHDFNNVLQAVLGGTALIERKPDNPERVARWAALVGEAAGRGAAITRRLLTFARRGDLRATPVDPADVASGLRDVLAHTLGARIEVRLQLEPGLAPLLADRGQLETTLVNLAVNARDAMPEGGVLTLSAAAETVPGTEAAHPAGLAARLAPGRYIRLGVADNGHGMSDATLARATEPFFTTKAPGEGTGLGLSMAKGFAQQSGGELLVESAPGQGTTIAIWLPQAPDVPLTAEPLPPPKAAAVPGGQRVLLVDDDAPVRESLAAQLAEAGFQVATAPGGAEALLLLAAPDPVDVLVTDLSMPGMDGLGLIREAQSRCPGLPAVLLTGYAGDGAALAVGQSVRGRFTLLRKPVHGAALVDQVAALMAGTARRNPAATVAER